MSDPRFIDTHAHVNMTAFSDDAEAVLQRALAADTWVINIGAHHRASERAVTLAEQYETGVYAVTGLHPLYTHPSATSVSTTYAETELPERDLEHFDVETYRELLAHPKVVAAGEIGLDHIDEPPESMKTAQRDVFIAQMELAKEVGKPVVFHCRKAYDDLISILESHYETLPGGILHSFMGRVPQAERLLDMGFFFSVNGLITFNRGRDKVLKHIPLERLVIETDAPYLTPEPHRGERNEPVYVQHVAEKLAEIKQVSAEEVSDMTTRNARRLFGI